MNRIEVEIVFVDMYGFCGRDAHPPQEAKGRHGYVEKYHIEDDGSDTDSAYGALLVRLLDDTTGQPTDEVYEFIDFEVKLCAYDDPVMADRLEHVLTTHKLWSPGPDPTYVFPDGLWVYPRKETLQ